MGPYIGERLPTPLHCALWFRSNRFTVIMLSTLLMVCGLAASAMAACPDIPSLEVFDVPSVSTAGSEPETKPNRLRNSTNNLAK